jgi:hypothetical protein
VSRSPAAGRPVVGRGRGKAVRAEGPVTFDTVRELALALPGVEEGSSYGTPALKVRGKLFVRLKEDGESFVLKADFELPDLLMKADPTSPTITATTPGCWSACRRSMPGRCRAFSSRHGGRRRPGRWWRASTRSDGARRLPCGVGRDHRRPCRRGSSSGGAKGALAGDQTAGAIARRGSSGG